MSTCDCVSIIPVIIVVIGIYILYTKFMKKSEVEHFNHQISMQNFQAQGCANIKPSNHEDCKCLRNNEGNIIGNNQCTRQINCVETVGQLPGSGSEYALVNPPLTFNNWIKDRTTGKYMDSKNIHVHIPKPCLHKNNKINRARIYQTNLTKNIDYESPQVLGSVKENVVQSNFIHVKLGKIKVQ